MQSIIDLLIGYSVFSSLIIIATNFRVHHNSEQQLSRAMGILVLLILATMQLLHYLWLQEIIDLIHHPLYRTLLFAVAPTFYLFSMPLLYSQTGFRSYHLLHLLPIIIAPWLTYTLALPIAFVVGSVYLLWLAKGIYALRATRMRFRTELMALGSVFLIALIVVGLAMGLAILGEQLFYQLYAGAIGSAFVLIGLVLGRTPRLTDNIAEAARETYAVSTLNNIDSKEMLNQLETYMNRDQLYQQPNLTLARLASLLELSNHQLSELINTQLGKSFSRYLREYRIEASEQMLLAEPTASVLSVGLSVGFASQSNFYEAFREITGMTPGKYRKIKHIE
ncbi:MAG: helix-turn-helix domain-containing protein [Gammaproteobacteria bacterium]|nr:helix-turn-helix domain-containing protein [Gammaproteobacteria bacterium]